MVLVRPPRQEEKKVDNLASTVEVILFFLFVIVGSIITAWIYRKIISGITTEKIDRKATKYGKFYGSASEKIVKKR